MLSCRWRATGQSPPLLMLGALGRDGVGGSLGGGAPYAGLRCAGVRRRGPRLAVPGLIFSAEEAGGAPSPCGRVSGSGTGEARGARLASGAGRLGRRSEPTSSWPPALAMRADLSLSSPGNTHWRKTM